MKDITEEEMAAAFQEINSGICEIEVIGRTPTPIYTAYDGRYRQEFRMYRCTDNTLVLLLDLAVCPGCGVNIKICDIRALPPGNGMGTEIIELLIRVADKYGLQLALESVPVGEDAEKRNRYWKRLGFVKGGGSWFFRNASTTKITILDIVRRILPKMGRD